MKKLWIHKKKITDTNVDDVLINAKEFSHVTVGDVLEIYHPEEEFSRLLLQITSLTDEFQQKDTISVEQSIASAFQLRAYKDVYVNVVDPKTVALDLVEVLFKDQYFSRSDMNRMRNSMINTCVYLNKKIQFSELRAQVNELWSKGEKVTCGVVSKDTRIVFRSSTAVVQIFIQMSSEMWEFDINGDLYFEKAVNGFLTDLFAKWKEQNCCHDVTIVMFSRAFYEAQSRDEFPPHMQECLQQDYLGRFYEDFYRIVVQNERYEDWTDTIKQLRKLFSEYPQRVLHYHERSGYKIPKAYNSTAAQGNFLETLNMTLNLFEKYYLDRNFDRTGKVAVVITPGAGVFEVDRELTNITKQRTIDCGVGSDLVCMGEQPLHAAPLFKFHSKNTKSSLEVGDDYNIPHWMNHSFYTSKNQAKYYSNRSFVPRIKVPPEVLEQLKSTEPPKEQEISYSSDEDNFPFVDYDEYDAQVFKLPVRNVYNMEFGRNTSKYNRAQQSTKHQPRTLSEAKMALVPRTRHVSDEFSPLLTEKNERSTGGGVLIPTHSNSREDMSASLGCVIGNISNLSEEDHLAKRPIVGSAETSVGVPRSKLQNGKRHRALINPFAPSRMQFKMTSNRRRWVHAFPTDPHGVAVQTHHVHSYSYHDDNDSSDLQIEEQPTREVLQAAQLAVEARKQRGSIRREGPVAEANSFEDTMETGSSKFSSSSSPSHSLHDQNRPSTLLHYMGRTERQQRSYLWGPTGEQEWTPELTTGHDWRPLDSQELSRAESQLIKPILTADFENTQNFCAGISVDWKSLTIPASLPITTDYLPEQLSLENDFVLSDYSLLPDDVNADYQSNPPQPDEQVYRKVPLTTQQVFLELISQRLAQGFQLIVLSKPLTSRAVYVGSSASSSQLLPQLSSSPQPQSAFMLTRARPRKEQSVEVYLSIGRIFHKLTLTGPNITVIRYRPRHPHSQMSYKYLYRFQAPDSYNYDVSWSEFHNEKLENFNWNYLDWYICTRGEGDYGLMDSLRYWRSRFFILPCNNPATKKIIDGHPRCDIYEEKSTAELKQLINGFIGYIEVLNKMRRTQTSRRPLQKHGSEANTSADTSKSTETGQNGEQGEDVLNIGSPSDKLFEAMVDPQMGMPMLPKQTALPEQTFISGEAVEWLQHYVKGVKSVQSAVQLLQRLLDDGFIRHSSGNPKHQVIYGFYLYTFIKDKGKSDVPLNCNSLFQNEWCEVAILPVRDDQETEGAEHSEGGVGFYLEDKPRRHSDSFLSGSLEDWKIQAGLDTSSHTWGQQSATLLHKYVNVEVDPQKKSERPEWATARYHAYYSPKCAFELQVQWMVSTGAILGELVNSWARKAGSWGFHILPVPGDPFALPIAKDSDPLRGPIFIPMNIDSMADGEKLFSGYDEQTKALKLLHLQETIVKRYGFMPTSVRVPSKSFDSHMQYEEYQQYVHCTGGMFILIEDSRNNTTDSSNKYPSSFGKKSSAELRKDYIARQTSRTSQTQWEVEAKTGFLWTWNYLSSKKWRSGNTGDEHFQDRVLADFRDFCANREDRLKLFWEDYAQTYLV